MATVHYDATVIGAGPAGLHAARQLAAAGLKVLVAEQRREIGEPVQCAEFAPQALAACSQLRAGDVAQKVRGIQTYICGEAVQQTRAAGFILNRSVWERQLAATAQLAGVKLVTGVRAVAVVPGMVTLQNGAGHVTVPTRYILGCDGPKSLVGERLGNRAPECCIALQTAVKLAQPLTDALVFFDPAYAGGYAWLFPKGGQANAGIAVQAVLTGRLRKLIADFFNWLMEAQLIQAAGRGGWQGGMVPVSGLAGKLAEGAMLVAGDAAGCTHPVTGAGIMAAVVSAKLAAKAVLDDRQGIRPLAEGYSEALRQEYGVPFARARERLAERSQRSTYSRDEFDRLIRRSWIAFPEYYRE